MKDNRKRIWMGLGIFLAGMLVLTLVSRGIYAAGLPQVTTQLPKKSSLTHEVRADGNVIQGRELAVNVPEGLRVREVFVRPGDRVEEGDLLLELDAAYIQEAMAGIQVEIEKLRLQIATLDHNLELEGMEKNREMERANEDGLKAMEDAQRTLARAQEDEALVRARLEEHLRNGVERTSDARRREEEQDYLAWEDRVSDAAGSSTRAQEGVKRSEEKVAALEKEVDWLRSRIKAGEGAGSGDVSGNLVDGGQEELLMRLAGREEELARAREELQAARQASDSAAGNLADLQGDIHTLPDFAAEDAEWEAWEEKRRSLLEELRQAERATEDASVRQEELLQDALRRQEDSAAPERTDAALGIYQMESAQRSAELQALQDCLENGGKIHAGMSGEITQVRVSPGERTGPGAALLYADVSQPLQFQVRLDKEQKKYVEQGREATVTLGGRKLEMTVDHLSADEDGTGGYTARIDLPEGVGTIGQSGTFFLSVQSEVYDQCIPLDALYEDGMGRAYVFVLTERSTVLGQELTAEKILVELLDRNEKTAAVFSGAIGEGTELIVSSTKEYKDGDAVRMRD